MTNPSPSPSDHQLTVIRAFLRQRFPGAELIDRFDGEADAHRVTLDPGARASTRGSSPPRRSRTRPSPRLLTEALVVP